MRKLEKISNDLTCIGKDEMAKVRGGIAIAEDTLDYCWEIETTEPNDANWNCHDAITRSVRDGVRQPDIRVTENP